MQQIVFKEFYGVTANSCFLIDLVSNFGKTDDIITYLQSASLFIFIYEKYPLEQVIQFWQKGSSSSAETFGTSLKTWKKTGNLI